MKKIRIVFLAMLIGAIAACSTTRTSAPILERPPGGGKTKPATLKSDPKVADSRGYYTVKKGDTLIHIALEFGQNYHDIITWNNLSNPNDIKVDQALRVLPPEPGAIPDGAQIGSVATASGVEVRPLPNPSVAQAAVLAKTAPRGDKRIYSEATWAELQKTDAGPILASASATKIVPSRTVEATKSAEKPSEVPNVAAGEEETVSWMWPADGKIVAAYDDSKKGIDIAGKIGQQVLAAGSGKVMYAGSGIRGYGNLVIVKHTNNLLSAYAHNKTILVKEGQIVNKGQKIAEMGSSDSDAVKLHFEIRQQGKPVDPSKFLPNR